MNRSVWTGVAVLSISLALPAMAESQGATGRITGTVKPVAGAKASDIVVFVEQATGGGTPSAPAVMDQKDLEFIPHVLPVVVGTTVTFKNSDTVAHNVFSPDHEKYNLGTFGPGLSKDHTFATCAKAPCAYVQLCMIHPEMEAYVVVLQNPYFAKGGETGRFTIENLPAGKYQVGVWAPTGKAQPKPVTVEAGKPATVEFTLSK